MATARLSAAGARARQLFRKVQEQRGAYALIRDGEGRLLIVQAENGRFYLPGGRIETGETPADALVREITEECGCSAAIGDPLCSGAQLILAGSVRLHASYWEARLTGSIAPDAEHQALWLAPAEAAERLHRASDRRAVALIQR